MLYDMFVFLFVFGFCFFFVASKFIFKYKLIIIEDHIKSIGIKANGHVKKGINKESKTLMSACCEISSNYMSNDIKKERRKEKIYND